jgi:hypothetical protein
MIEWNVETGSLPFFMPIMKHVFLVALAVAATALAGCASSPPMALERVGPVPYLAQSTPGEGRLLVKPAWPALTTLDDPDMSIHVDYRILSENGALYRTVRCWAPDVDRDPAPVILPAGQYRVEARAAGHGRVIVPVVIETSRTTLLCLNGRADSRFEESAAELVTLPGGAAVGWRAPE